MTGVVTGIAVAAGAAAWYLSRSGERFRDQYRVEDRLAELGDEMERRTRDLQASMNTQLNDLRSKQGATSDRLDAAAASAAEAEAAVASAAEPDPDTQTTATKGKKATTSSD